MRPTIAAATALDFTTSANAATSVALRSFTREARTTASKLHKLAQAAHVDAALALNADDHIAASREHQRAAVHHGQIFEALRSADGMQAMERIDATVTLAKITSTTSAPTRGAEGPPMNALRVNEFDKLDRSRGHLGKGNIVSDGEVLRGSIRAYHSDDQKRQILAQADRADASAVASEIPYQPGTMMARSDEEIGAIVRRGKATLSNPPLQSEYEQNAQHDEALTEQLRRVKVGYNALSDPARARPQMQTGTPPRPVDQMKPAIANASTMLKPATAMSDDELAAAATQNPDVLPIGELNSDAYARAQAGREARREIMRRALSPKTGVRTDPTGWSG